MSCDNDKSSLSPVNWSLYYENKQCPRPVGGNEGGVGGGVSCPVGGNGCGVGGPSVLCSAVEISGDKKKKFRLQSKRGKGAYSC